MTRRECIEAIATGITVVVEQRREREREECTCERYKMRVVALYIETFVFLFFILITNRIAIRTFRLCVSPYLLSVANVRLTFDMQTLSSSSSFLLSSLCTVKIH